MYELRKVFMYTLKEYVGFDARYRPALAQAAGSKAH